MSFDSGVKPEKKARVRSEIKPEDLDGKLVLMYPSGYLKADPEKGRGAKTMFGLKDMGFANLIVINDNGTGEVHENVSFLPGFLIGSIRRQYAKWKIIPVEDRMPVLARFGKGERKAGQTAPWVFGPFTEADAKLAEKYLSKNEVPAEFMTPEYYDNDDTRADNAPVEASASTDAPF